MHDFGTSQAALYNGGLPPMLGEGVDSPCAAWQLV